MYCPQCRNIFGDDNIYCPNDGTFLSAGEGEQETAIRVAPDESGDLIACVACGYGNRAGSTFCKKCGWNLAEPLPDAVPLEASEQHATEYVPIPGSSGDVHPGLFTPPKTPFGSDQPPDNMSKILLAAGVLLVIVVGGFFLLNAPTGGSSGNATKANAATETPKSDTSDKQTFERDFAGNIGTQVLTLHLKRDGHNLTGWARTIMRDELSGSIDDSGGFHLNAYHEGHDFTGIYEGTLDADGSVGGNWTKPDGSKPTRFSATQNK